jgi:hypothetical protein
MARFIPARGISRVGEISFSANQATRANPFYVAFSISVYERGPKGGLHCIRMDRDEAVRTLEYLTSALAWRRPQ